MERKLLSLPSFFVLLLIAGIAFLAVPVADVDADAPTVASKEGRVATNGNVVVTFTFSETLKTTGATAEEFDTADVEVTKSGSDDPITRGVTVTTVPADAGASPAIEADTTFRVTVPASQIREGNPAVFEGTVKVAIKAVDADTPADGAQFQAVTNDDAYAATSANSVSVVYDNVAPTVTIAMADTDFSLETDAQNGPFEVTFTLSQDPATTGAGVFVAEDAPAPPAAGQTASPADETTGDVTITGGNITASERNPGENVWRAIITPLASTPTAKTTEVKIKVAAGAVMDAAGNGNPESDELSVMIDNDPPTVTLARASTGPVGIAPFDVVVTIAGDLGSDDGDDFTASDVDVVGGEVSGEAVADRTTLANDYTVTIRQDGTTATEDVVVKVPADAVMDAADNGNLQSNVLTVPVTGGTRPDEGDGDEDTGVGTLLPGNDVGFILTTTTAIPAITISANGFVVLAKSPDDAGFTNALASEIDVKDEVWQNLRHFLVTTEGGTIDLIGPVGTTPVKSVVISEVMWGNDNGLSNPVNSQWIELYNTTAAPIDLTNWKLQFSTKNYGQKMHTGDAAKASASATTGALTNASNPVVDKLSTWREVGNYWLWEITDTTGGKYGQSGKSTRNSATSPGNPFELISMQRKIDYAKVQKTDHVAGTANDKVAENRNKQLEGIPGTGSGNWEASPEHGHLLTYRKGTPGAAPSIKKHDKTGVPRGSVVFNEIANRSDKKHDWIELYNKSGSAKKINGWELSLVTATDTDTELFIFTSDDDINVPAKGYLLIVNTDPRNTTLEGGYDVVNPGNSARQSDGAGDKPSRLYYVSDKLDIPKENFLLILRNGNDKTGTHEKIEDIAGNNPDFPKNADNTDVWPLRVWDLGATNDLGEKNDKTWTRDQGKAVFHGDEWKDNGGFTGVGIDRKYNSSDSYTSGTPGYANNAVQNEIKSDGLTHANPVIISEIMFGAGNGRVPQWIELHNPSHAQTVNLKNWKLDILNYYSDETLEVDHSATLTLPEVRIQPNQTVLIVSTSGRNSGSDEFPDDRIINVWSNTDLRQALSMQDRRDAILSATGFHLKLSDPGKKVVDEVGNIDANRRTNDEPDWTLPGGNFDGSRRSSMVRDLAGSANDGTDRDSWRDAVGVLSDTIKADELYYGDNEDVGTPGYTPGGVLPVQLSSFYSKRNDAGAVVITWSTESELDNAGFNILRSQSRTGEFVRINAQLIPGAGTTGEKSAYTWTDTSAKPNVLYFYQIEDVSLAGDHRTLRTTRLRGYIGAAGKAATTWGDLKSRE